ncbi:hypothetical protein B0H14DRAFT_3676502 [Mycena olivaceomarginata]|nr:hypothetical protein B0H14DRAFT_3676502 [Mycena olivaceomarginata]
MGNQKMTRAAYKQLRPPESQNRLFPTRKPQSAKTEDVGEMVYKINTAEEVYGPQVLEPRQHRKKQLQEVRPETSGDNPKEICSMTARGCMIEVKDGPAKQDAGRGRLALANHAPNSLWWRPMAMHNVLIQEQTHTIHGAHSLLVAGETAQTIRLHGNLSLCPRSMLAPQATDVEAQWVGDTLNWKWLDHLRLSEECLQLRMRSPNFHRRHPFVLPRADTSRSASITERAPYPEETSGPEALTDDHRPNEHTPRGVSTGDPMLKVVILYRLSREDTIMVFLLPVVTPFHDDGDRPPWNVSDAHALAKPSPAPADRAKTPPPARYSVRTLLDYCCWPSTQGPAP